MLKKSCLFHKIFPYLVIFVIFSVRLYSVTQTPYRDGQPVVVKSCLTEEPTLKYSRQSFRIEGIYVETSDIVRYSFGDCLKVAGTLKRKVITSFHSDFLLINPSINKNPIIIKRSLSYNTFHAFYTKIKYRSGQWRIHIQKIYYRIFSAPQGQLLAGIVLGSKADFSYRFWQALRNSGTMHMVAASGMNLVIFVSSVLEILAILCGRKKAIVLIYFLCWFYVFLTGLSPSIVRAGTMMSMIWFGQLLGRRSNSIRILLITAGVMLILTPLIVFDIGFWLSFTATGGIVLISPAIREWVENYRPMYRLINRPVFEFFGLKQALTETTAAYLATLPIIITAFHQTNPLSLIPNILILWLIPYLMVIGGVLAMAGLISVPLVTVIGQILWVPLSFMVWVIELFGEKIHSSLSVPDIGFYAIFFILLYYCVILKRIYLSSSRKNTKRQWLKKA